LRHAPPPLQVPSLPQVVLPASVHWVAGVGTWPAGTFVQAPTLPATAHERQVPVQAVAQQIPCAQKPELHSGDAVQVAPLGFLPQLIVMHVFGARQSAVVAHVVRHAPLVPHRNGSQLDDAEAGLHTPMPSHVRAGVSVEPLHVAAMHTVPVACCRHVPAPLHMPSLPQVIAAAATHWVAGASGGIPAGIGVHVPAVAAKLHDWHAAEQPVLQHLPCSQ
jgi:hypothetical protein